MKAYLLLICLSTTVIFGQTKISLLESTKKISPISEENIFVGLHAGDVLVINVEELNTKELKEIELIEYPSNSKFLDYKTPRIDNKQITINNTGIYKLRISNSAVSGRVCRINLDRIPAENTQNFNTTVHWKTVTDTTFYTEKEKYLISTDTTFSDFYSSTAFISSQNALNGNKNSQVISFDLPINTSSWSFYIGTGNEGKAEYERAHKQFINSASKAALQIPGYGPMAALALTGVSYINQVQGADNVKYWFLSSVDDVQRFNSDITFYQYKKGDVVNEAAQMKSPLKGRVYVALLNDNTIDPINVMIKATSMIVKENWGERDVKKMRTTSREVPYLK
jgi:hypothetical protein